MAGPLEPAWMRASCDEFDGPMRCPSPGRSLSPVVRTVMSDDPPFCGSVKLPQKGGSSLITVRTTGDNDLPGDGQRIGPSNSSQLARIQAGSSGPAIQTAQGAHHWKLMLLEIAGNGGSDLVTLGDGSGAQSQLSQVPPALVI